MYTETRNNFSMRNVILQFLFIALFVFILIWVFPTKKDMKNANTSGKSVINNSDLSVLYDRIFNENITAMKEAAQSYYTTERLPQKVGDSVKITLKEMLDKKIILPFKDKNGEQCDLEKSYVQITKKDNEFVMKVNLKCGEEENYLITYMGCYDYCSQTICEKKGYTGKVYKVVKNTTPKKHYCKIVNGKYYNNVGNVVSKASYEKACNKVVKYYCKIVNGKYYDKAGSVVTKAAYDASCNPAPAKKYYCQIVNGRYYNKAGKTVSQSEYVKDCIPEDNHYCEHVNGTYYDNNGNKVSYDAYKKVCLPVEYEAVYEYQYTKTTDEAVKYSEWSNWSTTFVAPTNKLEVNSKEVTYRKKVGEVVTKSDDLSKPIEELRDVVVGSTTVTYCTSYNVTSTITGYEESYIGTVKLTSAPSSTNTTRYEYVGTYNWYCDGDCTSGTVYLYKMYQRKPKTSTSYSCASTSSYKTAFTTKQLVVVGYEKKEAREPVYEYRKEKQYQYRTKTVTPGTTLIKWSRSISDTTLTTQGYRYTGVKKFIEWKVK